VRLLVDTAVLIYAVESPTCLSKRAAAMLEDTANVLEFSSVSLSEIAIKASLGKLRLTAETARQAIRDLDARVLPFTGDHAFRLFDLPLHHRDPFTAKSSPRRSPKKSRSSLRTRPSASTKA